LQARDTVSFAVGGVLFDSLSSIVSIDAGPESIDAGPKIQAAFGGKSDDWIVSEAQFMALSPTSRHRLPPT
jgi:hypothetical protein